MKARRPKNTPTLRMPFGLSQRRIRELTERAETAQRELAELRQALKEQDEHLDALANVVERMTSREADLRTTFLEEHNELLRRDDEIQSTIYDLQSALLVALQQNAPDVPNGAHAGEGVLALGSGVGYRHLIRSIREVVRDALPRNATVAVVSKGDDELLNLYGRRGWHFPQTEDGTYAGYYPAASTAAIAQLETLRSKGAQFLLFPVTSLWWLEHYPEFGRHLQSRYREVARREGTCLIFDLRETLAPVKTMWRAEFEETIARVRERFGHDPAVLDWNTGLDLAARFPECAVFSPPTGDGALPYLDKSIDIVATSSTDPAAVTEASRVATAAVAIFEGRKDGAEPSITLEVDWRRNVEAVAPPSTSIIIPSYNGIAYTEALLVTLRETLPPNFRGEIIVVDDASTDDTQARLRIQAKLDKRLRILRNRKNSGFIVTCNRGAKAAKGEIIIFFNNDTLALPGWLLPLLRIFDDFPDAGAVGGKLVFPDGRLQEAGGVVFSDGSAANFGKWDHAVDAPLYNYVREVDYATGAFIATKRSLFMESGGFDIRFRPIYYEETDYCFRLREMGYRVYYQPESVIIHLEGVTSGTDPSTGLKQYQVANRVKFVKKWERVLKRQPPNPHRFDFATWCALAVRDESEGAGYL